MSENDQTLPDTDQRPKVSLTKREQIMRNADKILADMNLRKDVVGSLLTHKELQPNWAKVRQNSLNFNKSGQLLANPVVSKLFEEAEPLMNQFQVRWFKAKIPCPFRGWSWRSFFNRLCLQFLKMSAKKIKHLCGFAVKIFLFLD